MNSEQQPSVTPFRREHRYIVIKRKELTEDQELRLNIWLNNEYVRRIGCVVIENDWPEYELVWGMLERRVTGQSQQPSVTQADGDLLIKVSRLITSMHVNLAAEGETVTRALVEIARHREASTAELRAENERLREALEALQRQALQSPDLIKTEWGQEALSRSRAALSAQPAEQEVGK